MNAQNCVKSNAQGCLDIPISQSPELSRCAGSQPGLLDQTKIEWPALFKCTISQVLGAVSYAKSQVIRRAGLMRQ